MVDNIVTTPLGLVLIVAAHMVFSVPSQTEVTGVLGANITLQFTFNVTVTKNSYFALYVDQQKVADSTQDKNRDIFAVFPSNASVFWHFTNLQLNDSGIYWAALFIGPLPKESNKVKLIVQEVNRSSTVPPMQTTIPAYTDRGGSSSNIGIVLAVSPLVLLVVVLPWLIWCLVRTKDKQQSPQQSSHPTVQATVEVSNHVPAPPLVYSILDFPKRPPAVLEIKPNDTEYAAVSYLPETRRV